MSDLVELLRLRVQAAYTAVNGVEPRSSEVELDAALEHFAAALLDGEGQTLANPATRTVARALLGVDGATTEWCVFAGPDPDADTAGRIVPTREIAEQARETRQDIADQYGDGDRVRIASRSTWHGPWRVETPDGEL